GSRPEATRPGQEGGHRGGGVVGRAAIARPVRRPATRSCVSCRTSRDKRELLRVVRLPDGSIRIDPTGRLAGRGAYVCRDQDCITTAIRRGTLTRALATPVPAGLLDELAATGTSDTFGGGTRGQE
ncbi:MAG: YlxR family protein, partial [Chloroflexota bacterium]